MRLTVLLFGVKYYQAASFFTLVCFVSLWFLTTGTTDGFCDKDGCPDVLEKGWQDSYLSKLIIVSFYYQKVYYNKMLKIPSREPSML